MKRFLSLGETGILLILFFLVVFFQFSNPVFLVPDNIAGILRSMAYPGLVSIGMAFCLLSGTIDLSVGATAGLASVLFAYFSYLGFVPAAGIALFSGLLVGLLNGMIITRLHITPFIMTICSMYAVRGVASWISNGYSIYPLPAGFAALGVAQPIGVSWAFFVMVVLMAIAGIFLDHTVWGLTVRATGSDKESAQCNEVDTNAVHVSVFVLSGCFSALAGILVSLIVNAGIATAGTGWELIAVAACAIGGVSLFGYSGSFFGLFLGLLTLQVIQNGIVVIGISPYTQTIVIGLILLISMILEVRRRRWLNLESI